MIEHQIIGDIIVIFRHEIKIKRFKELIGNINMSDELLYKLLNEEIVEINKDNSVKIIKVVTAGKNDVRVCYREYDNKDLKKNINDKYILKRFMIYKIYRPNID